MVEPLIEDFQEHVFEDSEVFFSGQQGKQLFASLYLFAYCVLCVRKFHAGATDRGFRGFL
jgi:hypothetical protein